MRVCLCVCGHMPTLLDLTWGNGRGCPSVVHYWADLQSMHMLHCCDNIARTQNVSECLYSLYAWLFCLTISEKDCWKVTDEYSDNFFEGLLFRCGTVSVILG